MEGALSRALPGLAHTLLLYAIASPEDVLLHAEACDPRRVERYRAVDAFRRQLQRRA